MSEALLHELDTALTLAYVNGFRAAVGQRPIKELPEEDPAVADGIGIFLRSDTCPIALSIGAPVYDRFVSRSNIPMPEYVINTVARLDKEHDARNA